MQRGRGFTLIEILIVIAILGIIAPIALPSYQESVRKSNRSIAKGELLKVLSRQESFLVNNKAYATTLANLGYETNPYYIDRQGDEVAAGSSIYQIALSSPTTTSFTIQAIPKNTQADDTICGTLGLGHNGAKSISSDDGSLSICW